MNPGYELNKNFEDKKRHEQDIIQNPLQTSINKKSYSMIAGVLLIIAGILGLVFWIQFLLVDSSLLESYIDLSSLQDIDSSITVDQLVSFLNTCAIIGCVICVFPILGGLLAIKKKLWGIAIVGSIIGLFSLGIIFTSSILSLISLILLIISKNEFLENQT